jgi:ectoine hydroxylase-related dioxygenase (phytanoyl-CoA dioxygenase family)
MPLTSSQLSDFHENGWVVVPGLISTATIATLRDEVAALHQRMADAAPQGVGVSWEEDLPPGAPPRIRQLMNSEVVCPTIEAILTSDAMLDIVEQLIGPEIILYHSKLMMKAANDGSFTPWHQDYGYWQYGSKVPSQVNCMLSIDAATEANGCIRFVPGSHQDGLLEHQRFQSTSFNIGLSNDMTDYPEAIPVETQPGDGVFFGSLVVHGSMPNTSPNHRRANTFAFDQTNNWLSPERNQAERVLRTSG